jgi:hypothetical protein
VKRVVPIILAVVLVVGIALAVVLPHLSKKKSTATKAVVALQGVIGADKALFLQDPKVVKRLKQLGLSVQFDTAGSRQIATSYDLSKDDFVWPSSDTAAQRILATHKGVTHTTIFNSPMVIATFKPIALLLKRAGLASQNSQGTWLLNLQAYMAASQRDLRWSAIPGSASTYPVNKSVLVTTADIRTSNSAAMYLSLLSYVRNGNNVVDPTTAPRVLPGVTPLFLKQGFLAATNDEIFNDYLVQGMGSDPMIFIYEAQFLERAAKHDGSITPDMVLMYPSPTLFTQHIMIGLTPKAAKLVKALTTDGQLRALEIQHGFRTGDTAAFDKFANNLHVDVPDQLVNVVDTPTYEVLESMIEQIANAYGTAGGGH